MSEARARAASAPCISMLLAIEIAEVEIAEVDLVDGIDEEANSAACARRSVTSRACCDCHSAAATALMGVEGTGVGGLSAEHIHRGAASST